MKSKFLKSKSIFYVVFLLVVVLLVFTFLIRQKGLRVREVIDGDTVILSNGEEVRYIGIDTPEESEPYFGEAKEFNRKMVEGKRVFLEYDDERRDKYFRILAYVWVESLLVNAELIKQGLAWVYSFRSNLRYRDYFVSLQKKAREKKIGVWSVPVSEEEYYVASQRSKQFVFHRPNCPHAKRILEKNKIIFKTREEALDLGYSPCRFCQP